MSYAIDVIMMTGLLCVTIGVYLLAGAGWSVISGGISMIIVSCVLSKGSGG